MQVFVSGWPVLAVQATKEIQQGDELSVIWHNTIMVGSLGIATLGYVHVGWMFVLKSE